MKLGGAERQRDAWTTVGDLETDNLVSIPAVNDSPARFNSFTATFMISFSLSEVSAVDHFVARGEELTKTDKVLGEGMYVRRRTAVVHGLGGIGKTQLVAAYTASTETSTRPYSG